MASRYQDDYLLKCPLCNRKLFYRNIRSHRKLKHPEISLSKFEIAIINAIKSGEIEPKPFDAVNQSLRSGTQKVEKIKKDNEIKKLFQGGRVSPR